MSSVVSSRCDNNLTQKVPKMVFCQCSVHVIRFCKFLEMATLFKDAALETLGAIFEIYFSYVMAQQCKVFDMHIRNMQDIFWLLRNRHLKLS